MVFRLIFSVCVTLVTVSLLVAGARSEERFSAWQMLMGRDPSIADDASVDWKQRLILHALTPRQAEEYFSGRATADELIVADGRTLSAALKDHASPAGGLYVPPSVSCRLFESVTEEPAANWPARERSFQLATENPSELEGSAADCPIPQDALALAVQIRVQAAGVLPRIKLWAVGLPEPAAAVSEEATEPFAGIRTATTIVNLCAGPDCGPARLRMKSSRAAAVEADLIGYFRPLTAADRIGARPIFPLATEGLSNNFFGTNAGGFNEGVDNSFFGGDAGAANTTGQANSFFGRSAGASNTTASFNSFFGGEAGMANTTACCNSFFGSFAGFSNTLGSVNAFFGRSAGQSNTDGLQNSFFGDLAGQNNTTGDLNSFFGRRAGDSNTTETNNTFIGAFSNGAAGTTNAAALGAFAQVSRSNSLVLGSIAGVNSATTSVNVGIGTPAPQRQLHLSGNNAVFRMDREVNTAAFILIRTNASGAPLKTFVVGTNASGADNGEFIINDLGQATGGPGARRMTITNAGETHFTGTVRAPAFAQTSSLRFKGEVETVQDAVELVSRLRGVSFVWKETGKPSLGLIAEEAAEVIPELVERDESGVEAEAINYAALAAVLVEAVKDQQGQMRSQQAEIRSLRAELAKVKSLLSRLTSDGL